MGVFIYLYSMSHARIKNRTIATSKNEDEIVQTRIQGGDVQLWLKVFNIDYWVKLFSITDLNLTGVFDATSIADGSVDNTEFQHLNGITSNIQTQLNTLQDDSLAFAIVL